MGGSVCVIIPSVGNSTELGIAIDGLLAQTYRDISVSYTHLTLPTKA